MTPQHDTPPRPLCQVCYERPIQPIVANLPFCDVCFAEATNEVIRLYRASLRLIQGGYPA